MGLTANERQKNMDMELDAVSFFSTGPCPGCAECGMPLEPTEADYDTHSEPFFSWSQCDLCHNTLGGDRHPAHARSKIDDSIIHYDICVDCMLDMNT